MAASFPASIKAFTTKLDGAGRTIFAAYVNDLQDEVVAVQTVLFTGPLPIRGISYTWPAADGTAGTQLTTDGAGGLSWSVGATVVTLADGATPALNAAIGSIFRLAAAGDRTIGIPTNPVAGQKIVIQHYASGGARTLALNTGAGGFRFGSDITALTQTASGKTDYIGCIYNGTDGFFEVVAVSKGY